MSTDRHREAEALAVPLLLAGYREAARLAAAGDVDALRALLATDEARARIAASPAALRALRTLANGTHPTDATTPPRSLSPVNLDAQLEALPADIPDVDALLQALRVDQAEMDALVKALTPDQAEMDALLKALTPDHAEMDALLEALRVDPAEVDAMLDDLRSASDPP